MCYEEIIVMENTTKNVFAYEHYGFGMCTDEINYVISNFLTNTVFRSRDNTVSANIMCVLHVLGPHLRNNRNSVPGIQNETAVRTTSYTLPNRRAVMAQCRENSQLELIIIIIL